MARPKRLCGRLRTRSVQVIQLALSLLLAGTLWSSSAVVRAAPVTFRFDTTVSSVAALSPSEMNTPLPFTVAEGDPVRGMFTFIPSSGSSVYPQSAQLRLFIGNQELRMDYEIEVIDNERGVVDFPGRIAEPTRTPNVDRQLFLADRLAIDCLSGSESYCGSVLNANEFKFKAVLIFEDDVNLDRLSSKFLPENPSIWNAFRNRELAIKFNNGAFVGAYIGDVRLVPEPDTACVLAVALGGIILARTRRLTR